MEPSEKIRRNRKDASVRKICSARIFRWMTVFLAGAFFCAPMAYGEAYENLSFFTFKDFRMASIGYAGTSLTGISASPQMNPASLATRGATGNLTLQGTFFDAMRFSSLSQGKAYAFLQQPLADYMVAFVGNNAALTIRRNILLERLDPGSMTFAAHSISLIQLDLAWQFNRLYVGASIRGGNRSVRERISVNETYFMTDYFIQTFFDRYHAKENTDFYSVGAGVILDGSWVRMGVSSDSILSGGHPFDSSAAPRTFMDSLSAGISFVSPRYSRDYELNLFVIEAAMDIHDIGSDASRAIAAGINLRLQMLPRVSLDARVGYHELKPSMGRIFQAEPSRILTSFGLSLIAEWLTVDLLCEVPFSLYSGKTGMRGDGVGIGLSMGITL
ncbi:hypothetical protein Spico_0909 [Parasphaerochaeta coccoides DSM 17374]|uniref:DUF5723 domain-containing protein n=2 Tax=Parasphaerochaeta TaxID=3062336 RepID=F4GIJ9_PARC1|nr:hypothetical protein Spico_0909 [Parasphaerochaeta coccoides DSM 17374]